jgi:hypothetical protein
MRGADVARLFRAVPGPRGRPFRLLPTDGR